MPIKLYYCHYCFESQGYLTVFHLIFRFSFHIFPHDLFLACITKYYDNWYCSFQNGSCISVFVCFIAAIFVLLSLSLSFSFSLFLCHCLFLSLSPLFYLSLSVSLSLYLSRSFSLSLSLSLHLFLSHSLSYLAIVKWRIYHRIASHQELWSVISISARKNDAHYPTSLKPALSCQCCPGLYMLAWIQSQVFSEYIYTSTCMCTILFLSLLVQVNYD